MCTHLHTPALMQNDDSNNIIIITYTEPKKIWAHTK